MKLKKRVTETGLRQRRQREELPVVLPEVSDGIEKNEYYLAVSRRYKLARLITAAAFLLFVILMMTLRSEDITTANLLYLLRDINISSEGGEAFSGVSYSAEPIQRFAVYRGELLYVTGREARLYSATGSIGLSSTISYEEPVIDTSDKFVLIYDVGGYGFSIYNSFSELHRGELDFAIVSGDIAQSGDFVLVAGGRERRATVYLYDSAFELRTIYRKGDYVSDAALSDDGEILVMTSFGVDEGEYFTDVTFYTVGVDEPVATRHIDGEYPLSLVTMEDGFAVTTTAGVYFYGSDGVERGRYIHGGGIGMVTASDKYVLLTAPKNALGSENSIVILDSDAKVCYNAIVKEKLVDVSVSAHGEAFLLLQGHAVMIDIADGTERTTTVGAGAKRLISTGSGTALLCMTSFARTVDFTGISPNRKDG